MNAAFLPEDALKAWRAKFKRQQRRKQPEGQIAESLVKWFNFAHKGFGVPDARLLVHVPNEGSKTSKQDFIRGARLKRMGKVAGVSDYILFVPRSQWHGMAIELKAPNGMVSDAQSEWLDLVSGQGYFVFVAYSLEEAMAAITKYLKRLS